MMAMRKSFPVLLLAAVWLGFLAIPLGASPSLSRREDFMDNGDTWSVGETEDYKYEVSGEGLFPDG